VKGFGEVGGVVSALDLAKYDKLRRYLKFGEESNSRERCCSN